MECPQNNVPNFEYPSPSEVEFEIFAGVRAPDPYGAHLRNFQGNFVYPQIGFFDEFDIGFVGVRRSECLAVGQDLSNLEKVVKSGADYVVGVALQMKVSILAVNRPSSRSPQGMTGYR